MIKIIYLLVLSWLLNVNMQGQDIFRIKFVYGNEELSLPIIPPCEVESFSFCFEDELNFLITYDKFFIRNFSEQYKKLRSMKNEDCKSKITPQIMSIIDYNGVIPNDTVCFGKNTGICQNGVLMKNNESLLALVKKKIGWNSEIDKNSKLRLNKRRDNNENMK